MSTVRETTEGGRMERKREETRHRVMDAALRLFREQGIDGTTMEQIAALADIAKGTLYHYYPVKEAIIDDVIKRSFQQRNGERIERLGRLPDTRRRMAAVLHELLAGVRAQRDLFERYFVYRIQQMITLRQDESQRSGLYQLEAEIIRLGQKSGEIRADLEPEALMALFEFVFIQVAQGLYRDPAGFDAAAMIDQYTDLFMTGARAQGRAK